ncbi:transposase [Lactococcus garvieae]|uniref:Transposase n=1 Tax=Lactococcus garvieae TaxID=1363 RepID=A0A1I4I0F4_9LACT|nr:helix-turn-helix domain-containing protein [Lactococcus garvieae]SFL47905.1 transposase [Lactococcus garvieae]
MTKYSFEFKLKVVNDHLSGVGGYRFLTDKYHVKDRKQIRDWVNAYKEFGTEGLRRKRQNKTYDSNFKLNAVNLYLTSEMFYREVANQLNLNNPALVTRWVRNYRQKGGVAFVSKPRGRPRKEGAVIQSKTKNPKKKLSELEQQLIETQKELLYLRVENEYLKGLRRGRREQQMREKPDLFKASKENSSSPCDFSSKSQDY